MKLIHIIRPKQVLRELCLHCLKRLEFLFTTALVLGTKTTTMTYSVSMVNKNALNQTNQEHWNFCPPKDETYLVFSCHKY